MSLRQIIKGMDLEEGDTFVVTGYAFRTNVKSDVYRLQKELGITMKTNQHEVILIDPTTLETTKAWLVTIIDGNNLNRTFKKRGKKPNKD